MLCKVIIIDKINHSTETFAPKETARLARFINNKLVDSKAIMKTWRRRSVRHPRGKITLSPPFVQLILSLQIFLFRRVLPGRSVIGRKQYSFDFHLIICLRRRGQVDFPSKINQSMKERKNPLESYESLSRSLAPFPTGSENLNTKLRSICEHGAPTFSENPPKKKKKLGQRNVYQARFESYFSDRKKSVRLFFGVNNPRHP